MAEKKEKQTAQAVQKPEVLVYCGPTVRGIAKQYTVYHGRLPAPLVTFLAKHPAAQCLCVPLDKFAETRAGLNTKGSTQATLYKTILNEL